MSLLDANLRRHRSDESVAGAEEFFNESVPGRVISVCYDGYSGIWHGGTPTRPAAGFLRLTSWRHLTPDGDIYDEQLAAGADQDGPSGVYWATGLRLLEDEPPALMRDGALPGKMETVSFTDALGLKGPLPWNREGLHHRDSRDAVSSLEQDDIDFFVLVGKKSFEWLCDYIVDRGDTSDGRHTKWMTKSWCTKDSAAPYFDDLLGSAIEMACAGDQADDPNLVCLEVVLRVYQLIEETEGSLKIEGIEHHPARHQPDVRLDVALALVVMQFAVGPLARETEIQKQSKKDCEDDAAQSGNMKQG